MAYIEKTKSGKHRAHVFERGVRDSRTFRTRREAESWGAAREAELRDLADKPPGDLHTLAAAMRRYGEEVCPTKRGGKREVVRIEAIIGHESFPADEKVSDLTPTMFADWRDARLRMVTAGSVLRDFGLVSAALEAARLEWRWIDSNPLRAVRKPRAPDHREVLITRQQVRAMLVAMGYRTRGPIRTVAQAVACCFLVALRSGMRAKELCELTWDRVGADYCALRETKTVPRQVPLMAKAVRLVERMRGYDPLLVFGISVGSLDANFRKYRQRAGLAGFTFHDSRHTAATWLARRLPILDLCRMFGWKNPKQALVYYNPSASSIAALLNATPRALPAHGRPR